MENEKKIDLIDYLVILVKWKKFLILFLIPIMILTYLAIYFFVEEQYDTQTLLIPAGEESIGGIAGLLGNLDVGLPFNIGGSTSPEMNIYNTIIYSRTNLEQIIEKFDLINVYGLSPDVEDYKKIAVETLAASITALETEYMAYSIEVRANSPKLSADINNYIIKLLNEKVIQLKTQKSKNNRIFLEERLIDIRYNLSWAEDSLMKYQETSGMFSPEEQYKGIVQAFSTIETELVAKKIQKSILEKVKGLNSADVQTLEFEIEGIEKKLREIKKYGEPAGTIPSIESLPEKAINYYRLLREVEINSAILQFILPLYEQAKIEEKKDIPTLQVIDYAIPNEKKSYPPRLLFTLLISFSVFIVLFLLILIKERPEGPNHDKIKYIRRNIFSWKIQSS
jgi:capsule polysaccharide export protein KpsE/RkpR